MMASALMDEGQTLGGIELFAEVDPVCETAGAAS